MSKSTEEYIKHILDEMIFLETQTSGLTQDMFLKNFLLQRAVARSLEIIGEAVKQIPETIKEQYPAIDWKGLAGLRDKLIHHYFGIDYVLVWDVMINEIPSAKNQVESLLSSLRENRKSD